MIVRELVAKLGFDVSTDGIKTFDNALKDAKANAGALGKKIQEIGDGITKVGKKMTLFTTLPIFTGGFFALKAYDKQIQGLKQVESALESTGGTAKLTFQELKDEASRLQANSLFGDEEILTSVTANLLTFTNISGKAFKDTQQAALNLSARLKQDLKSSVIQLGKALNDPVANMGALSRTGIQFSETQKAAIKSLVKSNKLQEAQAIILKELNTQFGGAAKAQAGVGLGPWKQLTMQIGDLMEQFGELIAEYILPIAGYLKRVVGWFQRLPKPIKKVITVVLLLIAIIGPLLIVIGTIISLIGAAIVQFAILSAVLAFFNVTVWGVTLALGILLIKLIAVIAIIASVGIAIWLLIDDYKNWKAGNDSILGEMLGPWVSFRDGVKSLLADLGATFTAFMDGDMAKFSEMMQMWGDAIKIFFTEWVDDIEMILGGGIAGALRKVGGWIVKFAEGVGEALGQIWSDPKGYINEWGDLLKEVGAGMGITGGSSPGISDIGMNTPAGVVASGAGASTNFVEKSSANSVQVKSTINLTLPDTTTEENRRILSQDAEAMVERAMNNALQAPILANPVRE